jgi:hypothetical protein
VFSKSYEKSTKKARRVFQKKFCGFCKYNVKKIIFKSFLNIFGEKLAICRKNDLCFLVLFCIEEKVLKSFENFYLRPYFLF